MIRTVTFDFWETLVNDSRENLEAQRRLRVVAIRRVLDRAGVPLTADQAVQVHDQSGKVLQERYWRQNRDPSYEEQVRLVLECAAPGVSERMPASLFREAVEAYISPVLAYPPELTQGAEEAVQGLAERGIRLGIISNTGRTPGVVLRRVLERHGLLRYFETISYSDEIGYRKPDPEIFRRTLERAGCAPGQAAHVGDNPLDDVLGAQGVGMRAIHYAAAGRDPAAHADLTIASLAELPAKLFRVAS